MKTTTVALFLALFASAAQAGYQDEIDAFFGLFEQQKMNEAVDRIYSTNSYVSAIPDQVRNIKNQLTSLAGLMGRYHGAVKIDEYMVKGRFVQVTYLVTYERQPLRFEFQFFKAGDNWKIYSFSFDDDIDEAIEAAARERAIRGD